MSPCPELSRPAGSRLQRPRIGNDLRRCLQTFARARPQPEILEHSYMPSRHCRLETTHAQQSHIPDALNSPSERGQGTPTAAQ